MRARVTVAALCAALSLAWAGAAHGTDRAMGAAAPAAHPATGDSPAKKSPTAQPPKRVDINKASRAELKTLPGVGDAEAGRIIAARPFLTKADLVTQKVLPEGIYVAIKNRIVASQSGRPLPKK